MRQIDKPTAHLICGLLHAYGIHRVVVSPGSRCAPLTVTLARSGFFDITVVIDERTASFVALGMTLASGKPVALVCTSGSAVLNYGPALAEAFYRRVPLIAISADRPEDMIDVWHGQTIRQYGALDAVVRRSINIRDVRSERELRFANRLINETLQQAVGDVPGPVHINMQFDAPLTPESESPVVAYARKIVVARPEPSCDFLDALEYIPADAHVVIAIGAMPPDETLSEVVRDLEVEKRALVLAEVQSNLPGQGFSFSDELAANLPAPDYVVTLGGSLVSASLKTYLEKQTNLRHMAVGYDDVLPDTFGHLVMKIEGSPAAFLRALCRHLRPDSEFVESWTFSTLKKAGSTPLLITLQALADSGCDMHFSNGMAIRYAQDMLFAPGQRVECNRGVSGIEGATSTAIGYAKATARPTMLISGDMSAAYDVGALAIEDIPASFRMVVIDNGGGDIFRRVLTTAGLPERDRYFVAPPNLPLRELAAAYGFDYCECRAGDIPESFLSLNNLKPAILKISI